MSKRKFVKFDEDEVEAQKKPKQPQNPKKNSLDSDEEDDEVDESEYMLNEDDIEGEEDGVAGQYDEIRTTAFNMREEREEGHFDANGHYIWNKEKEIKDNWLDNIDWQQIKKRPEKEGDKKEKGLGDESDDEDDITAKNFDLISCYKEVLKYMEPKETIAKTLQRLGKSKKKLTTIERIKLKKAGLLDTNEQVIKLTELVNTALTQTGNMDVYQETYESLTKIISKAEIPQKKVTEELDMYADDFDTKEKQKLGTNTDNGEAGPSGDNSSTVEDTQMWEFKWDKDDEKIEGPNTTEQMQKWVEEGYFKKPVWVRRTGQEQFYSSSRIDFELYLS